MPGNHVLAAISVDYLAKNRVGSLGAKRRRPAGILLFCSRADSKNRSLCEFLRRALFGVGYALDVGQDSRT